MNVLVPLLESRQKRDFLRNGTIIHILGESVDCLQDGFFRAHTVSVSLRILDASPAFKPNDQLSGAGPRTSDVKQKREPGVRWSA